MLVKTPLGRFQVFPEGTITRALQAGQWWDVHLKPILDEAPTGWAIDIGAHFGWFTRYLSHRHLHTIAVEPWPESFLMLLHNMQIDPLLSYSRRVSCWPIAAYDEVDVLEFAPGNDTTDAGAFGFTSCRPDFPTPGVLAAPLDLYLPDTAPVTVIKCDAQGADLRALKGMEQTIRRCRPLIVFEWEEEMAVWQGDWWEDYLSFFEGLNYSVERITTDFWDYVARPKR